MCVFCQELVKMVSNQEEKREDRFPEPPKKCLGRKREDFFSQNGKFCLNARLCKYMPNENQPLAKKNSPLYARKLGIQKCIMRVRGRIKYTHQSQTWEFIMFLQIIYFFLLPEYKMSSLESHKKLQHTRCYVSSTILCRGRMEDP